MQSNKFGPETTKHNQRPSKLPFQMSIWGRQTDRRYICMNIIKYSNKEYI